MFISRRSIACYLVAAALAGCNQPKPQDNPQSTAPTPVTQATTAPDNATPSGSPSSMASSTPVASATSGGEGTTSAAAPFEKSVELQGHKFEVKSAGGEVSVTASAPEMTGEPQLTKFEGTIVDAEIADLDANGSPEVYVYAVNNDPQKTGRLIAYASNGGKSITPINLPPLNQVSEAKEGYRGGDELRVVENRIVQRWSVYKDGDEDGKPSGGTRQIQWKLEPGEAMWQLTVDKVVNY